MNDVSMQILGRLVSSPRFVSGGVLSGELGMTRSAIWKHIVMLRAEGYGIEAVSGRGYRLTDLAGKPLRAEVEPRLATSRLGRCLHWHEALDSTNLRLKSLALEGAAEGTVVVADSQSGGRGRLGRTWESPPGVNLYFSMLLRPSAPLRRMPQLTLLLAVALHEALSETAPGLDLAVKWPNDLLSGGRKLSGILCEMQAEGDIARFVVAGIGINVNQAAMPGELAATASSLRLETGRAHERPALLASILNRFEPLYDRWQEQEEDLGFVLPYLRRHSWLEGREVAIDRPGGSIGGRVAGLSAEGELRLRLEDGRTTLVSSGEARLRKTP